MDRSARPFALLALSLATFSLAPAAAQETNTEAAAPALAASPPPQGSTGLTVEAAAGSDTNARSAFPATPTAAVTPPPKSQVPPSSPANATAPVAHYPKPAPHYQPTYPPHARRERHYDGPPLLLGRRVSVGGYGGVGTAYTHMLDRHGALVSFEGALLLAHKLSIGATAFGFSRTPPGPLAADGSEREFGAGYGGFVARYAFLTQLPLYFSAGLLVGGGAVVLHRDELDHSEEWDRDDGQSDGFFVVQPELSMHANLTRWMRLGVTAGYRITSNVDRFALRASDLNGVVLGGTGQFGWI